MTPRQSQGAEAPNQATLPAYDSVTGGERSERGQARSHEHVTGWWREWTKAGKGPGGCPCFSGGAEQPNIPEQASKRWPSAQALPAQHRWTQGRDRQTLILATRPQLQGSKRRAARKPEHDHQPKPKPEPERESAYPPRSRTILEQKTNRQESWRRSAAGAAPRASGT